MLENGELKTLKNVEDEVILVSENSHPFLSDFFRSTLLLLIFIFVYSQSIVYANWFGCIASLFMLFLLSSSISLSFKRIIYFSKKKITIADHKNQFISEIEITNNLLWNAYTETQEGHKRDLLVVKSENNYLIVEKNDYRNYDSMVNYFKNSLLIQDPTLTDSYKLILKNTEYVSELDLKLTNYWIYLGIIFGFLFGIIINNKSKSTDIQYFTDEIKEIHKIRKSNDIEIKLKHHPELWFRFSNNKDAELFSSYNYIDGNNVFVNLNKKIKIGILKTDYEWRIKNKFIQILDISSLSFEVENYQMLE